MKKIFLFWLGLFFFCANAWAGWPHVSDSPIEACPITVDLNADGVLEVITGSQSGLYCLDPRGTILWKYKTSGSIIGTPSVADINGDGKLEVIACSTTDKSSILDCLDRNGKLLWKYAANSASYSPVVAADIDDKAGLETLFGTEEALFCLNKNGQFLWKYNAPVDKRAPPAVCDIDNDANNEILFASTNGYIYCLNTCGGLIWRQGHSKGSFAGLAVDDINNDGNMEIIYGWTDSVNPVYNFFYCLDNYGERLWSYTTKYALSSSPAIADINGDGYKEILFTVDDQALYCLDKNGKPLWCNPVTKPVSNKRYSSIAVGDLDNNGSLEILTGTYNSMVCYNRKGTRLWSYGTNVCSYSPALGDLDNDGLLEIIYAGGSTKKLYCLNKDGGCFSPTVIRKCDTPACWPVHGRDLQHCCLFDRTSPTKPVVEIEKPFTNEKTVLRAEAVSTDKESKVVEYQYRITRDSTTGAAVCAWTSNGKTGKITAKKLSLAHGKKYYFNVKAKNSQGLWSAVGYSSAITVDTVAPVTTASGIDNAWHNTPVIVTLKATDNNCSGIDEAYYTLVTCAVPVKYRKPFTVSEEGAYTLRYYAVDHAGNVEDTKTAPYLIKIDKTAPICGITINKNAATTSTNIVTLDISASDNLSGMGQGAKMQFSNDNLTWSEPEAYSTIKTWTLSEGNANKVVYCKVSDAAGNWSKVCTDNIELAMNIPEITSVSRVLLGIFLQVKGKNFGSKDASSKVTYLLNGKEVGKCAIWSWSASSICTLGIKRGYSVQVHTKYGSSNIMQIR